MDRGELDKIIERTAPAAARRPAEPDRGGYEARRDYGRDGYGRDDDRYEGRRSRKKKSLLGDIFDF